MVNYYFYLKLPTKEKVNGEERMYFISKTRPDEIFTQLFLLLKEAFLAVQKVNMTKEVTSNEPIGQLAEWPICRMANRPTGQ